MRICVILEGSYPYVTGGVSSWMQQYIKAMPQHEFVVWTICANDEMRGSFRYELPDNVVEVREIALAGRSVGRQRNVGRVDHRLNEAEQKALYNLFRGITPDWEVLFDILQKKGITPHGLLTSRMFQETLSEVCREEHQYAAFGEMFHTMRSMMMPLFHIMASKVPQADVYHSISTGYAGILARLGSHLYRVPYLITEHGIYSREREEELIRAKWVLPDCRQLWIRFFYLLSEAAYSRAGLVTSLFQRAKKTQIELKCPAEKCRVIANGIGYDQFCGIPPRKDDDGTVHIGAVLRLAPIKDVKTMIYAFSELKKRFSPVKLYIAGPEDDPKYARECLELVERLGVEDILFLGTVNVKIYMKEFDFTVLSSISEGQPLSVLESFAAGRPCVVTDVGCCKELVYGSCADNARGGETPEQAAGICVPPMQPHALSLAMEKLCRDRTLREAMGREAKRRAEREFRHETMVRNYLNAYDEVFQEWQESDFN